MIGQSKNIEFVLNTLENFPKFLVIVGSKGSGKKTFSKFIAKQLNAQFSICGIKVEDIRNVIDTASSANEKTVYCIADADKMSQEAKNALLKITEEPPNNAYFILTVCDEGSLLGTIKSRAFVLTMEKYSKDEIKSYFDFPIDDRILQIADNIYEAQMLLDYGDDFIDYLSLVVENIGEVEPANAFKSSNRLAIKKEEDGYDLNLFWKSFYYYCYNHILENKYFSKWVIITAKHLKLLQSTGVSKEMLYDHWVLEIRRCYG